MSCSRAIITEVVTIFPDKTVTEALKIMDDNHVRGLPVVDGDGIFLGDISFRSILRHLLPAAVTMEEGLTNIDFMRGTEAEDEITTRLEKLSTRQVAEIMNSNIKKVEMDTSLYEAIRILVFENSPVPVVERETNKFLGILTYQSVLSELRKQHSDKLA